MIASALTLFIYRMLGCMAVWVFIVMADRNIAPYSLSVAPDCQLTTKIRLMPTQSLIDLCRALRHVTSVCLIDSEADRDALLSLPSHPIPSDGVSVSGCQKWYICGPGPRNTRNKLSVYHAADTMPCVSPVAHTIIHRFIRYILPTRLIFCHLLTAYKDRQHSLVLCTSISTCIRIQTHAYTHCGSKAFHIQWWNARLYW